MEEEKVVVVSDADPVKRRDVVVVPVLPPRECPSGSEGQTCGENWPDFIPVFVGLKVEKKIY
ncbi:hypothetical protein GAO37_29535 [Bacteroides thetaiotaomicron]|nr:hypothetical protein GAO37_29535 [Bacteroides thetaiotaomicron]